MELFKPKKSGSSPLSTERMMQPSFILSFICVLIVSIFTFRDLSSAVIWSPSAYKDNVDFVNLTSLGTRWDIQYGKDALCENVTCIDVSKETIVSYKRVLPNETFGEESLVRDQVLKYSLNFVLPDAMVRKSIGIHSLNFFSKHYEFFVNGVLVKKGDGIYSGNFPIPTEGLEAGSSVNLVFKVDTHGIAEPGFDLRSNLVIGPIEQLDQINQEKAVQDNKFVLWLTLPRLLIAFLFGFGTMFFAYSRDYIFYVLYMTISALKIPAFYGSSSILGVNTGMTHTNLYNVLDMASSVLMFMFIYRFYRQNRPKVKNGFLIAGGIVGAIIVSYILFFSSQQAGVVGVWFNHLYKGASLIYFTVVSYTLYRYLKYTGRSPSRKNISLAMTLCFGVSLAVLPISFVLTNDYYFHILLFELLVTCLFAACVSTDLGKVRAERDTIRKKMGVHVDEGLVQELISTKDFIARNVDEAAILFIDIRGFTEMSESFSAQEVFNLLNIFHNEIIDCVYEHKGIIDKFMGDSLMALWGVRHYDKECALRACLAAISMSERLDKMNAARLLENKPALNYGIAVHVGSVVAGHIGNERRAEFSVIGSAVNIASRLEGLTARLGRRILISETVYDAIKKESIVGDLGYHQIRGISTPFQVYSLIGVMKGRSDVTLVKDARYRQENVKPWPHVIDEKIQPTPEKSVA
jgi:class 3 adenylate cyclase